MSSQNNSDNADAEEQHELAFGGHTGISSSFMNRINEIRNNNPNVKLFQMTCADVASLGELAWELLGQYIANNTHLNAIKLGTCGINNNHMRLLFQGLIRSDSIVEIDMSNFNPTIHDAHFNQVGLVGIQCMIPFLKTSPQLINLNLYGNRCLNNEGFQLLINTLDGGPIEEFNLGLCSITDISALGSVSLPRLRMVTLNDNKIGGEGIIMLSNILQKETSTLTRLHLGNVGIGDEDIKILADSLKYNTKLSFLDLTGNEITEIGYRTILNLLNDISSIENTYKSNHTLTDLFLNYRAYIINNETPIMKKIKRHIDSAITMNRQYSDGDNAHTGRVKVIHTQLNSANKMELAAVQGIEYSYDSMFSGVDALVRLLFYRSYFP